MIQKGIHLIIILLFVSISIDAQVINAGVGGNCTTNLLERIDSDVLNQNPDVVIVMVGTNDMLNSRKMISYKQYATNLETIVSKIKNSGAEVVLLSPPTVDSTYLFERHNRSLYFENPNVKLDSARHIVKRIAKQQKAHFIDIYKEFAEMNLPRHNKDLFIMNPQNSGFRDGVHPTPLGYSFIAQNVFQYLNDKQLVNNDDKIICFGDSITFGSKVEGSGTAKGETYLAYLSNLISKAYE